MNCISGNTFSNTYFGKKSKQQQNTAPLNIGVLTPPDKLPTCSLYCTTRASDTMPYRQPVGGKKLNAGKLSAILAFTSMALAGIAYLPFIRKR